MLEIFFYLHGIHSAVKQLFTTLREKEGPWLMTSAILTERNKSRDIWYKGNGHEEHYKEEKSENQGQTESHTRAAEMEHRNNAGKIDWIVGNTKELSWGGRLKMESLTFDHRKS